MLTNLSLFSGVGGLDLGARIVGGFRTVCYVENDAYAQAVLLSRMRDGSLDDAPIFEDVRIFRGTSLRGNIDVVSGGFPCQDVSNAGKRVGIGGERSGLWSEYGRIIREVRPRYVVVENVPGLITCGGIGVVLWDLASIGYDVVWFSFPASRVGAPHSRERVWIIAYPIGKLRLSPVSIVEIIRIEIEAAKSSKWSKNWVKPELGPWDNLPPSRLQEISGCDKPPLLRMDDVLAEELDENSRRLKSIGNGVCSVAGIVPYEIVKKIDSCLLV